MISIEAKCNSQVFEDWSPFHLYDEDGNVWLENWKKEENGKVVLNHTVLLREFNKWVENFRKQIPVYEFRRGSDEEKRAMETYLQIRLARKRSTSVKMDISRDKFIGAYHRGLLANRKKPSRKVRGKVVSSEEYAWRMELIRHENSSVASDSIKVIEKKLENGSIFLVCTQEEATAFEGKRLAQCKTEVPKWQQKSILGAIVEVVERKRNNIEFSIKKDQGDVKIEGKVYLRKLRLLTFEELRDVAEDRSSNSHFGESLEGILFSKNTRWDSDQGYQWNTMVVMEQHGVGYVLWVPKILPMFMLDTEGRDRDWDFDKWEYSPIKTEVKKPFTCGAFFYRYKDNDWDLYHGKLKSNALKRKSGKGNGRGRADRASESVNIWGGDRSLGYGIGLDLKQYVNNLESTPDTNPYLSSGAFSSEIGYIKKYSEEVASKKNQPFLTIPVEFKIKDKFPFPPELRIKQKGPWVSKLTSDGRVFDTQGRALLHHETGGREQAGAVMGAAFTERGLDGGKDFDLKSATQFANWVLTKDPENAGEIWDLIQATLYALPGQDVSEGELVELRKMIRTSQEWCHLFGHGDGGEEVYGNFVSGSEHCNTEQLAIETGQRRQKLESLTAKITAYLLPSTEKKADYISQPDLDILYVLDISYEQDSVEGILSTIEDYLEKSKEEDIMPQILPDEDHIETGIPSKADYETSDSERKKYVNRTILGRLRRIVNIPLPLGYMIRYKLYKQSSSGSPKIFDHLFYAQSEGFNEEEFDIYSEAVQLRVQNAHGLGKDYERRINQKIELRKVQNEEEDEGLVYKLPDQDFFNR